MRSVHLVIVALLMALVGGCQSTYSSGSKIDSTQVSKIVKGVTTRAQIESMFGAPTSPPSIGKDGSRTLMYMSTQTSRDGKEFIPLVGPLMTNTSNVKTQYLQIVLNPNGVVTDYEFSDQASATTIKARPFGSNVETTAVDPASATK